jgi:hypothetical protein
MRNEPIREIYANYRYELLKVGLAFKELTLEDATPIKVQPLLEKADRLETLIDLYAYLLAVQGNTRR